MKKAFSIYAALTGFWTAWAILFCIQHWPGLHIMATIAFGLTIIGSIWGGIVCNPNGACSKAFTACASVAVMVIIWAIFFQYMQWPGKAPLLILSLFLATIVSIWGGFACGKGEKVSRAFSIFLGFTIALVALAILFKVSHWPGAAIMLLISLGVMLPAASIWGCISYIKHNK